MTDVSLREYVEALIAEHERATALRFNAAKEALELATRALHEKHEQMNKFREETVEDRAEYARRSEVDLRVAAIERRCDVIEKGVAASEGRSSMIALGVAGLVGMVTVLLNLLLRWWPR